MIASPLTVRAVLATAPALIFFLQVLEGRLSASSYSLTAALAYTVIAVVVGLARQRAIRAAAARAR
jgi:hypothetical protein